MWPCSARLRAALAGSGDQVARVEILADGQPVATIDGTLPGSSLIGGGVTVERSVVRRHGEVTLVDVSGALTPTDARSLLVPLRGEVRLWVGRRFVDATWAEQQAGTDVELVPVGTLVVVDVDLDYPTIRLSGCYDRMWIAANTRFTAPLVVAAGTNVATAITQLLTAVIPASKLALSLPATDLTTGALTYDEQSSPADAVTAMATAAGWSVYADPMGTIVAVAEVDATPDAVVASYVAGPGSMLLKARRNLSGQGVFNAVLAVGEDPALTAPVRGYAEDTDPGSITYAAEVGVFAEFYGSPLLRTSAQALLAAQTKLRRDGGIVDTVAVTGLPDPTLEAGDVLQVDDQRGITRLLVADSFPVSLTPGQQDIACRSTVIH